MTPQQSGTLGGQASAITRRAAAAKGRTFAQAYRRARGPVAYTGPYPILTHRTCAETARDEAGVFHDRSNAR